MLLSYLRSLSIINHLGISKKIDYFNSSDLYKYIIISIMISSFSLLVFVPVAFAESSLNSSSMMVNSTEFDELFNKASNFYDQKKYNESLEDDDKALSIEPSNIDALNGKADIFYDQQKYDEALQVL